MQKCDWFKSDISVPNLAEFNGKSIKNDMPIQLCKTGTSAMQFQHLKGRITPHMWSLETDTTRHTQFRITIMALASNTRLAPFGAIAT